MQQGRIIILNGTSSSGKTTLARVLQKQLSTPFYFIDIDTFVSMEPPTKYMVEGNPIQHDFLSKIFDVVKLFSDMGYDTSV